MKYFDEFNKSIIENMINAFIYCEIITDENRNPIDYKYIEVNKYYEKYTGLNRSDVIGKRVSEIVPNWEYENSKWIEFYGNVSLSGKSDNIEKFAKVL